MSIAIRIYRALLLIYSRRIQDREDQDIQTTKLKYFPIPLMNLEVLRNSCLTKHKK